LHHLIRPARGGAVAVVGVFALLLWLASYAGFLGIPLAFILASWFFKYAYILFDHVVRGVDEPPTLDISMMNPIDEQRPLAQLAILLVLGAGISLAAITLSLTLAKVLAVLAILVLPASVAILGLESSVLKAVSPVALARMIAGLGTLYAAIFAIIMGAALIVGLLGKVGLWMPVQFAVTMFAILSLFSTLGGALYERRHELGLEAWHSPERTAAKEEQIDRKQSDSIVTDAYGQVRVGAHTKAWAMLQAWLDTRDHAPEDYRWLIERVSSWPDPRYATRLTEKYVGRLLELKRSGEALDAVVQRLRVDKDFRPKSAVATLTLARLAAHGGGAAGVARILLSDFGKRFAGDPLVTPADALARHLGD
ncbi:MAG: hypothetical protein M3O41_15810, partial [Pseudomonadota bacterium]|nr:hypothetical protein [Pseudomonadota bacterium]